MTSERRILMLAFHFPPIQGSSGVHRTLAFARYLPEHGWQPTVLTADPVAYASVREENLNLIPAELPVFRAFARDTSRHFSIRGKYPKWLALPDRWVSWALGATLRGLRLVRRERPDVILSTYPIASAHLAGLWLSRLTGIPLIADFRDPMAEPGYPPDPQERRVYQWIERHTLMRASRVLVTTAGTRQFYEETYPEITPERIVIVPNGYDEVPGLDVSRRRHTLGGPRTVLLHSGIVYPKQRNPEQLFSALAELKASGEVSAETLQIHLRACGHEDELRPRIASHGITDLVKLLPPLGYLEAAQEIIEADALLLLQADVCNRQIPAKAYEYLSARRPILGLADPVGDTGRLLLDMGVETVAALEDRQAIKEALLNLLSSLRGNTYQLPDLDRVETLSRRASTAELARTLDDLMAGSGPRA